MSSPPTDYPRPDFQRSDLKWQCLDGPWDFAFDDDNVGQSKSWPKLGIPHDEKQTINVPYVFQSPASGINKQEAHPVLWYQRSIKDPRTAADRRKGDRVLLKFGAVDWHTSVWVEGSCVGQHRGGHVPFEFDVSDALGENESTLVMRVYDSANDLTQPRGKQYWEAQPRSIFYTPSSGIWQSVWLEVVPATRIADSSHGTIIRSNNIAGGEITAMIAMDGARDAPSYRFEIDLSLAGVPVSKTAKEYTLGEERLYQTVNARLTDKQKQQLPESFAPRGSFEESLCWLNDVALWTPEKPLLYEMTLRLLSSTSELLDEIKTYTGMRSLDWTHGDGTFRLNGRPLFQRLCLDQGYWPSTLMTPPAPASESLKKDIELAKSAGFSGCRKHQKVEDPRFLYWADKLGYLVWGEMANSYAFNDDYIMRFDQEWVEAVKRDINHPSMVTWTPVNESWGYPNLGDSFQQRDHIRSLVYATKALDPTRPVNDNCGWEHVATDLTTYHEYADSQGLADRSATLDSIIQRGRAVFLGPIGHTDRGSAHMPGAPVLCTEYGGVDIAPASGKTGEKNGAEAWGYTTASDPSDLLERIRRLTTAVVQGGVVCGLVYTQLTDVEQEVNGLYTYDRRPKLDPALVKAVFDEAERLYFQNLRRGKEAAPPRQVEVHPPSAQSRLAAFAADAKRDFVLTKMFRNR